jgi:UDP-N-acetylmuramoyl-L-alanyl-D-glutamate--2,6-diaminopimelate ligase
MDAQSEIPRPTPDPISLDEVCRRAGIDGGSAAGVHVTGVTLDSRDVRSGDLFIGLPGERVHGARFSEQAVKSGAVAVMTAESGEPFVPHGVPCIVTADPRAHVGDVAAEIYHRPADDLLMLGVTGTNGKTTTTYLLESGLRGAGHRTGIVGTVGTIIDGVSFATSKTTPEATELHGLLAVMRERGVTAVAMEVSSHALAMGRVDGFAFDVAGFTQLSVDHLDFHRTESAYYAAKALLFQPEHSDQAVVTIDDDGGRHIREDAGVPVTSLGFAEDADWKITNVRTRSVGGYRYELHGPGGMVRPCDVALMGRFNISNAALSQVMLARAGIDWAESAGGIASCEGVPGRMERVGPSDIALVVDYAHTTDALRRAIDAVRPAEDGRVIVVFGCGGDRDPSKRAPMGAVAARQADIAVITDDNPRSESADDIRQSVLEGAQSVPPDKRAEVVVIGDRRAAIEAGVRRARRGDVVLVAGKGHETGQEVNGVVTPFDDRVELLSAWERVQPHLEPS